MRRIEVLLAAYISFGKRRKIGSVEMDEMRCWPKAGATTKQAAAIRMREVRPWIISLANALCIAKERRQRIARATYRAVVEQGPHHMNVRDIARALGTTTGPLRHYVRCKDELLVYTDNLLIDDRLTPARDAVHRFAGALRLWVVCEALLPSKPCACEAGLGLTAFNGLAIGDGQLSALQVCRYSN